MNPPKSQFRQDGRRSLGTRGELIAVRALQEAGLRIVERNWRCRAGELDIIAEEIGPDFSRGAPDKGEKREKRREEREEKQRQSLTTHSSILSPRSSRWLVVVEVRTRRGHIYGSALQAFTPKKQEKLRKLATIYVQEAKWSGPWRIDAVAVQMDRSGKLISVEHIRHAVTG